MRILMTTDTVGGVWTYCVQLAKALQAFGVHIVLAAKGQPSADQVACVAAIDNVTLTVGEFKLEWMEDPWGDVRGAGEWLLELADAVQPDVVHLNDFCHGSLQWQAPTVIVGHSCVLSWFQAVRGKPAGREWDVYCRQVQRGLRQADMVVAPSRHMLQSLKRLYGSLRSCRVIQNGCDSDGFYVGQKAPFVFSAGRLWDDGKNLKALAAAAPQLEWPIHVAGLPHPEDGHAAVNPVPSFFWLGRLNASEMAATYARAAIYALPALYEPFGLTVLEAALSGCALVLGDIPTLRENWSGAALFVPPRDVHGLVRALNRLALDSALRRDLSWRACTRGRELTARRMAGEYFRCYCKLKSHTPAGAVA